MLTTHHSTNSGVTTACGASVTGLQSTRAWTAVTCQGCLAELPTVEAPSRPRPKHTVDDLVGTPASNSPSYYEATMHAGKPCVRNNWCVSYRGHPGACDPGKQTDRHA